MRIHKHELGTIKVPDADDRLDGLFRLASRAKYWAADTETNSLNQWTSSFSVRIVQMGTRDEAWILRPDFPRHMGAIARLLQEGPITWWHNWLFDAISTEQSLGVDFERIADRARCTDILSRLIDPRPTYKGGTGHKLEQLAPYYLGTTSKKDAKTALYEAWGRKNKVKIADIFAKVPVDLCEYEMYAGQDVFLGARLAEELDQRVSANSALARLAKVEQPLSRRVSLMQRTGMPFDYQWADKAEAEYDAIFAAAEKDLIEKWKIEPTASGNVHSAAASQKVVFAELGAELTKKTKKGQVSLDSEVLKALGQESGDIGELARTILSAKRNRHYGDYIRNMRDMVGRDGRIHPNIHPMKAATARMSISDPPAQQFPRGDDRPRGCLLADEDEVILTADYAQIEFRVAAAASQDPVMIRKIKNGEDLHEVTALTLFGKGFNKDQRQAAKPVGFGRLYLGGAPGIRQQMIESDTTGFVPPLSAVVRATKAFDKEYRVQNRWARRLVEQTERNGGHMVTLTGRPLIVDPVCFKDEKTGERKCSYYPAANYAIQSPARDVFAAGISEVHRRGMGHYLRLVVHDEVVLSVPKKEQKEVACEIEEAMATTLRGVPIVTESEIKGERWKK